MPGRQIAIAIAIALMAMPATAARGDVIVSLGDSYSSGEGASGYDSGTDKRGKNKCHRTPGAWPRLLGTARSYHLACSGAKIDHLYGGKEKTRPDNRGQLERLDEIAHRTDIDVALMTIGGNDVGFGKIIFDCRFFNCLAAGGEIDQVLARLDDERLVNAYKDVKSRSRARHVVAVGYPDIVPARGRQFHNCDWITDEEKGRLHELEEKLDAKLAAAASKAHVHYLSMRDALENHELCTNDSWMRPITSRINDWVKDPEQGHPDPEGQLHMWRKARSFVNALDAPPPGCTPAHDVSVIVDDSGSMEDNDPEDIRRRALELLITKPSAQARTLGAVEFGSDAAPLFPPTNVASGQGAMLAALGAIAHDNGGTDYNEAFAVANGAQPSATARIFLTDGEHNRDDYLDGHAGGPRTYVIGLNIGPAGESEAANRLDRIARETSGRYFPLYRGPGDDAARQVARLQPTLNEIDSLLACQAAPEQARQTFARQGQVGGSVVASFEGEGALEVVASWGTATADIDLAEVLVRDRRGRAIADLKGRKRVKGSKKRRQRVRVSTIEGETFDTITMARPSGGVTAALRFRASILTAPVLLSVQLRPLDSTTTTPGTTPVGAITGPGTPPATPPQETPPTNPTPPPPRHVITVDNRVTNGGGMREDPTPARLTTQAWTHCTSRGCNINGTERVSGQTYDAAVCQTQGERTTNGHDTNPSDDANPELFTSNRYYGVRLGDGTFGYVSEVWIRAADRGGLGLPTC